MTKDDAVKSLTDRIDQQVAEELSEKFYPDRFTTHGRLLPMTPGDGIVNVSHAHDFKYWDLNIKKWRCACGAQQPSAGERNQ